MDTSGLEFGGIVVPDSEWEDYAARTTGGRVITERFAGDTEEMRIWRDPSGGGLMCQKGPNDEPVPMYRYSDAMADPNTEAVSASAVFMQRLIAGGLPVEVALGITNRIYSCVPHSQEMSVGITNRIVEQWRNRS
jgi:hypothetical protein